MKSIGLRDSRWDDLIDGRKVDTIRLQVSHISEGFLVYRRSPTNDAHTVVWVVGVQRVPLSQVPELSNDKERRSDPDDLLVRMQQIYPDVTLDTEVDFIQHLTPDETAARYPQEVSDILHRIDRDNSPALGLSRELREIDQK